MVRVDDNIRKCAESMVEVMRAAKGVGLSANQVGLPFRMFVVAWRQSNLCLINPVLTPYGKLKSEKEGCLSFPGIFVDVKRRAKCRFKAWSLDGHDVDEEVEAPLCRILQHEMDHLDGRLFIDRLSEVHLADHQLSTRLELMKEGWERHPEPTDSRTFDILQRDYCGVPLPESI